MIHQTWDIDELEAERLARAVAAPPLDPSGLLDQHIRLAARTASRLAPGTRVAVSRAGTVTAQRPGRLAPDTGWKAADRRQLPTVCHPRTAHEVVQLRRLHVITRAEARRMLGLPVRWYWFGR